MPAVYLGLDELHIPQELREALTSCLGEYTRRTGCHEWSVATTIWRPLATSASPSYAVRCQLSLGGEDILLGAGEDWDPEIALSEACYAILHQLERRLLVLSWRDQEDAIAG